MKADTLADRPILAQPDIAYTDTSYDDEEFIAYSHWPISDMCLSYIDSNPHLGT